MTPAPQQSPPLVLIIAAAGYGKSTALELARPRSGMVIPARTALDNGLPDASWIGLDDLQELCPAEQLQLSAEIAAALRKDVQIVLTSRLPLAPEVRRQLRGQVRERGPEDLALDPYAVRRVLVDEYGVVDPEVPVAVHALTSGWPTLVHFAADILTRHPGEDLRSALTGTTGPATHWLREEVLATITPETRRLLTCVSGLGAVTPDVCRHIANALGLASDVSMTELRATGIVSPLRGVGRQGQWEVVPAVAHGLLADVESSPSESCLRAAGRALGDAGLPFGAAVALVRAGDRPAALRLFAERGDEILRHGDAAGVVEIVQSAPEAERPAAVQQTYADALRICGELAAADRVFRPLVEAAQTKAEAHDAAPVWPPALANSVAAVHYHGGRLETALDVLTRARMPATNGTEGPSDQDDAAQVECMSSRVHVLCSLGRHEEAVDLAAAAVTQAEATGDPGALAAAHLAMARVSSGERKEAHHEHALRAATESGDVITASRILVNKSCQLLSTARFADARRAARAALAAADIGIATGRRAAALHNLAEALMQEGDYDEASWHLHRAIALCRHLGEGRTALGLLGLAEIHRQQGSEQRARTRYLEAIALARGSHETQVLVPALAGLARLYAVTPDEQVVGRDEAQAAADEAMQVATGPQRPFALTAAGWVAQRGDDRAAAWELARASVAAARELEAFDLLAEALELSAACADHVDDARRLLTEALAIWVDGGARPPARRVELQLGWLEGADGTERSRAREAARELQRLGVQHVNGRVVTAAGHAASVGVAVLGGFRVTVEGSEVPLPAWRSRQARTLVKILAARRGRPATRAWLCETLWPDDDPAKTGHRLSVLLATVRGVLDPERTWPTDRFISVDTTGVRLDLRHVTLDADTLIRDAEHAAALMDSDEPDRAAEILADINTRYCGDAFEDEPGEDWADGVREEVRAAWQRSVRRLAALRRRAGRLGDAQTLLVRLLAADPFDEKIHHLLVKSLLSAGRHGEARRAFARWSEAMKDIGAPAPDPVILAPGASRARPRDRSASKSAVRLRPVVTSY